MTTMVVRLRCQLLVILGVEMTRGRVAAPVADNSGAGAMVVAEDVGSKLSVSAEMFDALAEISARAARGSGEGDEDDDGEDQEDDDAVGKLARSIGASDDKSYFESYRRTSRSQSVSVSYTHLTLPTTPYV